MAVQFDAHERASEIERERVFAINGFFEEVRGFSARDGGVRMCWGHGAGAGTGGVGRRRRRRGGDSTGCATAGYGAGYGAHGVAYDGTDARARARAGGERHGEHGD